MANNGYLLSDNCVSLHLSVIDLCRLKYSSADAAALNVFSSGSISISCRVSASWGYGVTVPAYNCEIPGPPLTETQQIEAINALFPSAIAILAIAWGFKYIRVLVAEWLKERNASD